MRARNRATRPSSSLLVPWAIALAALLSSAVTVAASCAEVSDQVSARLVGFGEHMRGDQCHCSKTML